MALNQGDMASNQETTEPNCQPCDGKAAETGAACLEGQEIRRRNYEKRIEKQRLTALVTEEQCLKQGKRDEGSMRETLRQIKKTAAIRDVPIGCVIVRGDGIIARGYNRRNADESVLPRAEVISIKKACKKTGDWRLEDCTMYVTLEPCPMCTRAIVQARIPRIAVGCTNPKAGCAGSVLDTLRVPGPNHRVGVAKRVLEQERSKLMSDFFQNLCERKKEQRIV